MLSSGQKFSFAISLGVHGVVAAAVLAWPGFHPAARSERTELPVLHLILIPEEVKAAAPGPARVASPIVSPVAAAEPVVEKRDEAKPEPPVVIKLEPRPELVSTPSATVVEAKVSSRPLTVASSPSASVSPGVATRGASVDGVPGTNRLVSAGVAKTGVFKTARVKTGAAPEPEYPLAARRRRMEGSVLLLVGVGENGDPARVRVRESSGSALLDTAAVEAVRRWQFEPAQIDGGPVASELEVPVRFQLTR